MMKNSGRARGARTSSQKRRPAPFQAPHSSNNMATTRTQKKAWVAIAMPRTMGAIMTGSLK